MVFLFLFFLLFEKKMLGESTWNKRVEAWAKNERVERELEGKLPSFSAFFFFSMVFFFLFFYLRKIRCQEKALEMEVQKQEGINESQKWDGRGGAWR
jgi:Na+-transporting methylmalonyl-CoA/oxaloacetate decarboxylase gamma subunit